MLWLTAKRNLLTALLTAVLARALPAQTTSTSCQVMGTLVRCTTAQGVVQLPGWGADVGRNLGNVINQALVARQRARAQEAYTQALREAQALAQAEAEAQRRAAQAAELRARAQAAAAEDIEQARQRLFAEKAISVVIEVSETFSFQGKIRELWVASVTSTLQDLYKVQPEATRLQIFDAVAPKLAVIQRAEGNYFIQHLYSPQLRPHVDSLQLQVGSPENERFMRLGLRAVQPLFMQWPAEINTARFREAMEPVYAEFRKPKPRGSGTKPGSPTGKRPPGN